MDELDIMKPEAWIEHYNLDDVDAEGLIKKAEVKSKETAKEEEKEGKSSFEFNKEARINSEYVFDNLLPPLMISLM